MNLDGQSCCSLEASNMSVAADAQRGATYANFTADRVIYAPTDLVSIAGRILAFNASDQATAFNLGKGFNVSAYNPGGDPPWQLHLAQLSRHYKTDSGQDVKPSKTLCSP